MVFFYENYVRLCNKVGKSPSGVALEIGLSKTAVNGWKHGRSKPTDATIQRVADYFGITAVELMSENENKPAPSNGNELDIEKILNNITDEQLADIIITAVKSRLTNERIVDIMMVAAARLKEID